MGDFGGKNGQEEKQEKGQEEKEEGQEEVILHGSCINETPVLKTGVLSIFVSR